MAIYLGTTGGASGGAHIPSSTEFNNLKSIMDGLSLTTSDDYKVKLHMPLAGNRNLTNASLSNQGSYGFYWSSSPYSSSSSYARYLLFRSSGVTADDYIARAYACSVRLFNDEYVEPDNTWTVVEGSLGSAGIFYNATLGLISVTNGTDKNITMKDKNEGATTVYNDGDTLTQANMGNHYQWGNYYGFPSTGTVSNTSSTQVSTAGYGGSNPYYSDTFITGSTDWSNPRNDNLRANSSSAYFTPVELMELKELYLGGKRFAYYPLTVDAKDYGGVGRDIVTSGATSYGSDGAVLPDSNHTGLLMPFNIDSSQKWTICAYTKLTGYNHTQDTRLIDIYNSSNRIDIRVDTTSHQYRILKNNSSSPLYSSSYTLGEWLCICITVDNGSVKIYTNGTLNATTTFTGITTYFRFGQEYNVGADRHLYGNIKEIIIESKARTAEEVTDYFNETKSNYGIS